VRRLYAALTAAVLVTSGCSLFGGDGPDPGEPARAFLAGWQGGDAAAAGAATDDPAAAQAAVAAFAKAVGGTGKLTLGEVTEQGDDAASAAYTAEWTLPAVAAPWTWTGTLPLVRTDDTWTVRWAPSDLHPRLTEGGPQPKVTRQLPERAAVQDSAGRPLFTREAVVTVGVEPRKATDLPGLAARLAAILKVTAADVVAAAKAAKPDAFVPVITLRRAEYEQVKPQIYDLPGTVFQTGERLLGPTARFAQPTLGRVGEATAEVLKEAGPGYAAGDQLGTSGLQRALNPQLAGKAGATVTIGANTVASLKGTPGTPVRTTLDRAVQTAADAAVATQKTATALVAVRPSTGEVVAVANNAAADYDIALTGKFPPGSTFKILTATALLGAGVVEAGSAVDCPGTVVVNGKEFENANKFDLGRVPLRTAFARSCNTTFTTLAGKLDDTHLSAAATYYGLTAEWKLPVPFFGGSVPAPKDATEKAADAIGQGRVETSPLAMALVAATVAKGTVPSPSLIAGQSGRPDTGGPEGPPAADVPVLRDMMRAVVTEGTATALRSVPGGPVAGKTGTAEYGTEVPPRSHAWFAGYQGDLAFAVFVEDGQSSSTTAVPVAARFLTGR
jgi:cell division protein FtsI/penicillin-binding protein 2